MKFICPNCERPIYNRRVTKCEFCSEPIPEELLYSAEELKQLDNQHTQNTSQQNNNNVTPNSEYFSTDLGDAGGCE